MTARPLVIVGMPRSGTTWVKEVLETDPSLYSLMEPDSEGHRASAIWGKRRAGRFPVLAPGDRDDAYRTLWAWILDGAPETPRLRVAAKVLHTVKPAPRKQFLRGGRSSTMSLAALLGARPAVHRNPVLTEHRLLVKTVHTPLSLEWLAAEFDVDVLVVMRHPGSILASWIALDYNDQYIGFCDREAVRALAASWGVPMPGTDHLDRTIWQIGVLACALEQAVSRHPTWTVRLHEDLCRQPSTEFRRLSGEVGVEWSEEAESTLAGSDRPGQGFRTQRLAAELPDDWKRRLTTDQIDALRRVLDGFPLQTWSASDFTAAAGD